jgi:carboxyl-terminal processing protease
MIFYKIFILLTFANLGFALDDKKSTYQDVLIEIEEVLDNYHFKKNVEINLIEVCKEYINTIDSQKVIFTEIEFKDFCKRESESKKAQIDLALNVFNFFKQRSSELITFQKEELDKIIDENQLNTNSSIFKDREKEMRFKSIEEIFSYQLKEAKSELITIHLKEKELKKSIAKLMKRFDNRIKSLNRVSKDDIFSLYVNSYTGFYDPHTNYMTPKSQEDFEINMYLSLEGIGAILTSEDGITKITRLIPGGPAEKSGLIKVSDKIVGVGSTMDGEIEDVRDWRIDEVVKLIRGPKKTKVRLEILSTSSSDDDIGRVIEITRDLVKLEDQAAKKKELEINRSGKIYKIGIIELPTFYMDFEAYKKNRFDYKSSSKDVRTLLRELDNDNTDGVILDLRGNGGGSLYEAYSLAKLFIGRGNVVQVMESSGSIQPLGHTMGRQNYSGPVAILVDKLSASASEILAGAIQDYERGLIIGSQTFGKGTVQRMQQLSYGQIKFTEQKFYRVSGQSTQHEGVKPDINLPFVYDDEEIGEMSYENALPYDDITPVYHRSFDQVSDISPLKRFSKNRVDKSPMNIYLKKNKDLVKKNELVNLLPINLTKRKMLRDRLERSRVSIENNFRISIGLSAFNSYDELLDSDPEQISDKKDEIILNEAADILIDQISLNYPARLTLSR